MKQNFNKLYSSEFSMKPCEIELKETLLCVYLLGFLFLLKFLIEGYALCRIKNDILILQSLLLSLCKILRPMCGQWYVHKMRITELFSQIFPFHKLALRG